MTNHGHAAPDALALVDELRSRLSTDFVAGAALDLALLCIEPMHAEDESLVLVDRVLAGDPSNAYAAMLRAYLALHVLILDEDVRAAIPAVEAALDRGQQIGAGGVLLDEMRQRLQPELPDDANIELLEASVRAEPNWTINHTRLARALRLRGEPERARAEFDLAIANVIPPDSARDPLSKAFDDVFTGRTGRRERIVAERDRSA